eukprot:453524-Pyramimonas_sp.AAC.1
MRKEWEACWCPTGYESAPKVQAWEEWANASTRPFPQSSCPKCWAPDFDTFMGAFKTCHGAAGLDGWSA